jgi:hypothetical protein
LKEEAVPLNDMVEEEVDIDENGKKFFFSTFRHYVQNFSN